jgi:hypothetical protein
LHNSDRCHGETSKVKKNLQSYIIQLNLFDSCFPKKIPSSTRPVAISEMEQAALHRMAKSIAQLTNVFWMVPSDSLDGMAM